MNKKGVIGEGIMDMPSIILIFIILVLFFFLIKYGLNFESLFNKGEISVSEVEISNNLLLLNYLRTPYNEVTIADLVIKSVEISNFEELDIVTANLFEDSNSCFELIINEYRTEICPKQQSALKFRTFRSEGSVLIPTKNKKIIEVRILDSGEFYE